MDGHGIHKVCAAVNIIDFIWWNVIPGNHLAGLSPALVTGNGSCEGAQVLDDGCNGDILNSFNLAHMGLESCQIMKS